MQQNYVKLKEFKVGKVGEVLKFAGDQDEYFEVDDKKYKVHMSSLRYHVFKRSRRCAVCGVVGIKMVLEYCTGYKESDTPHFNLYARHNGKDILMTKDHIIPRSKGGPDHFKNLQTMCAHCNKRKKDKLISNEELRLLPRYCTKNCQCEKKIQGSIKKRKHKKGLSC